MSAITTAAPLSATSNRTRPRGRICLVTGGMPATNPRLVKEACALRDAGFDITCVTQEFPSPLAAYNDGLLEGIRWIQVEASNRMMHLGRRFRQEAARSIHERFHREATAFWASTTLSQRFLRTVRAVSADLYIGHTLAALPAAVWAARKNGALAGFDAEDFHSGETGNPSQDRPAAVVERLFLKQCAHLTSASPLISDEYERRYGVRMEPILNVFPRRVQLESSACAPPAGCEFSIYWFSQTIGPERGIEEVLAAIPLVERPVRIFLRGNISTGYRDTLFQIAAGYGVSHALTVLPPAAPNEMISLAAQHDLGLSIEIPHPYNHQLCLANKIFTYLSAGIPQLISRTPAQEWIAAQLGPAAAIVDLNTPESIARALRGYLHERDYYQSACQAAMRLAQGRFSWEEEQKTLVRCVENALAKRL